jgi:hypothetical protein
MNSVQVYGHGLPQHYVNVVATHAARIRPLVRCESVTLTTACRQNGLPIELAELCAGLLASVVDDLHTASTMPRTSFERAKRLERVMAACEEPCASALRVGIAASPTNGRACARHWDAICDKHEIGRFAWLLGLDTDTAYRYSKKVEKRG